jgi:hypothetical protein
MTPLMVNLNLKINQAFRIRVRHQRSKARYLLSRVGKFELYGPSVQVLRRKISVAIPKCSHAIMNDLDFLSPNVEAARPIQGAQPRVQNKESSQGSQPTQCVYRVERAALIGRRLSRDWFG